MADIHPINVLIDELKDDDVQVTFGGGWAKGKRVAWRRGSSLRVDVCGMRKKRVQRIVWGVFLMFVLYVLYVFLERKKN